CFKNPATVHAMCEDYRATFGVDLEMDAKDFDAGRKITCPVLVLWGATGGVGRHHDSKAIWPRYATDIRGAKALPSGHYLAEEAREDIFRALRAFSAAAGKARRSYPPSAPAPGDCRLEPLPLGVTAADSLDE